MDLFQNNAKLHKQCVRGLCEIASRQLKIRGPIEKQLKSPRIYIVKPYALTSSCSNVVTFKLDDGTNISANRDFLSEKCDYFNRLLSGDFKESQESEIKLPNVDKESFNLLLNMLEEDVNLGLYKFNLELNVILDVISLADKFMLMDLSTFLAKCVEQTLTPKTVAEIYRWSIESGTNLLRIESVAFALVGEVTRNERYLMFQRLFNLGYSKYLVEDISNLLTSFLRQYS